MGSQRRSSPRTCGYTYGELRCRSRKRRHVCAPRADRAQDFFERLLVHTKGRHARKPFILEDFQRDEIIRPLFGEVRWDGELGEHVRRFRQSWIEVARKNGKSELLAGIALLLLVADDEEGAEIYGAAKDRDQARKVWDVAERMVKLSPILSKRLVINASQKRISDPKTGSYYEVIAADAGGNLGHNPHGIIFDEVLTQPNGDLWNALATGTGTRSQPLMVAATTAGNDPNSFAAAEHDHAQRIADDPTRDETLHTFIRNAPRDADWTDLDAYRWPNPALGLFLREQVISDEIVSARQDPRKENAVRQFRLNQWVRNTVRMVPSETWARNGQLSSELDGVRPFGGLDVISSTDFAAWVLAFPSKFRARNADGQIHTVEGVELRCRFWVPEAAVEGRKNMSDQIHHWADNGWLSITSGDVADYETIEADILADRSRYNPREYAYAAGQVEPLRQTIDGSGLTGWKCAQTYDRLAGPTEELFRLLGLGGVNHIGDPVLEWMIGNTATKSNTNKQQRPDRTASTETIAGTMALVMALAAQIREREAAKVAASAEAATTEDRSIYQRGARL